MRAAASAAELDEGGELVAGQPQARMCAAMEQFGQALARHWGLPEAIGRFSQASALAAALIVDEAMDALHAAA